MQIPPRCTACTSTTPQLSPEELAAGLSQLPQWRVQAGRLERSFTLSNFRKALAWINRVGMLAEQEGHHPDFHLTSWNRVQLVLWTHAVAGLTLNDLALALQIDGLAGSDGVH